MLSENQVVIARKAMERMYFGLCTVIERVKVQKPNGASAFEESVKYQNVPCRLSVHNENSRSLRTAALNADLSYDVSITVKLFIAPELDIKPNSKIIVTQNSTTTQFLHNGFAAKYATHQELSLTPAQNKS